jgi:hypothetical protein
VAEPNTPLTDADFAEIKARLTDLDEADRQIARAQRAGIDIGDAAARSKEQREQLMKIRQVYFPGKM